MKKENKNEDEKYYDFYFIFHNILQINRAKINLKKRIVSNY